MGARIIKHPATQLFFKNQNQNQKMKKFISRIYLALTALFSYNPLSPRLEHLEFFSPKGKSQRISKGIDTNLDRAHSRAMNLESFESMENAEDLENYSESLEGYDRENYNSEYLEELENYRRKGHSNPRRAARKSVNARYYGKKKSSKSLTGAAHKGAIAASYTINVQRLTNRITKDLPVMVFNNIDILSDFSILKRYLPAGVGILGIQPAANRADLSIGFIEISTGFVDTIVISCSEVAYTKLLAATVTDLMQIGKTLYKISDEAQQQAFNQKMIVVSQSLFGFGKENPITLTSYVNPRDFRKDSVNIPLAIDIDKQTGLVVGIPYVNTAVPNYTFTTTLAIDVNMYDQWTRSSMKG